MKLYKNDFTFLHIFPIVNNYIWTFFFFENHSTLKKNHLRKQIKSEEKKIKSEKKSSENKSERGGGGVRTPWTFFM